MKIITPRNCLSELMVEGRPYDFLVLIHASNREGCASEEQNQGWLIRKHEWCRIAVAEPSEMGDTAVNGGHFASVMSSTLAPGVIIEKTVSIIDQPGSCVAEVETSHFHLTRLFRIYSPYYRLSLHSVTNGCCLG